MEVNSFILGFDRGKASMSATMNDLHMVRFFNDDNVLLYTVFVPTGMSAMYAGETPVSTEDETLIFKGFEPSPTNITTDLDTYAKYDEIGTLDQTSWARISELSAEGTANNYFAIGDIKTIHIEGTVQSLEINGDYGVYIIGFNHNSEIEGNGITFGTFKNAKGKDICFTDSLCGNIKNGEEGWFNMNVTSTTSGGWRDCRMRYAVLGSVHAPNMPVALETTTSDPVPNSLMSALPADLRAVMKRMTIWTDCLGGGNKGESGVIDTKEYLPLLAFYEVTGKNGYTNSYERKKQKQYSYFIMGNSWIKCKESSPNTRVAWWTRSPSTSASSNFHHAGVDGTNYIGDNAHYSQGVAPIFRV